MSHFPDTILTGVSAPIASAGLPREMTMNTKGGTGALPPAILLGGGANALSVARSLGQAGVRVYALNYPSEYVCYSRYCTWIPRASEPDWAEFLLGSASDALRGAVLLACSDAGIELLMEHRSQLAQKFLLDDSNPEAQRCMLNKLCTYRAAQAAGVPTPRFWVVEGEEQLLGWRAALVYPLLVKPLYSHRFENRFGKKFTRVQNWDELLPAYRQVRQAGIDAMLVELIPGPDSQLCSYYTYLDRDSAPLFHFTKRILRRYPEGMGGACYHITDWNPEVRDLGLQLFRHVGLRGLANVEFKRDLRDGQLKLIECNARFTAANCLVADSGFDLARLVYDRLTGRPVKPLLHYRRGLRLWYPVEDYHAFKAQRQKRQLSWRQWLGSIAHPQTLPFFRWYDPQPTLMKECIRLGGALKNRLRRVWQPLRKH